VNITTQPGFRCKIGDRVRVSVPATTANLGPGFDCLGMALSIANIIDAEVVESGLTIDITGEGSRSLVRDERNRIYQCMVEVFKLLDFEVPGLHLRLHCGVPVERGLGSSATAAVGGLAAANKLCGEPLSDDELLKMACKWEGHPDNITPAVLGGLAVSVMADDEVIYTRLPVPSLKVVLFVPDFAMQTEKAREVLPGFVPYKDAVHNVGRVALLVAVLAGGHTELLPIAIDDRLHEPYRAKIFPELMLFFQAAREAGASAACLSGSGSNILALTHGCEVEVENALLSVAAEMGISGRTIITSVSASGYEYLA
jgi:homoserine kinase